MKIVSFNLRCQWKADGINGFIHRAGFIYDKIQREKPAVVAFQEVIEPSLELLKKMFPEYEFFGSFRLENYNGEGLFTAVLKEEFQVLAHESFWISPTPYVAGSRFKNQSEYPRVCVMTKIRNKTTGEIFRVFNVHLDHISDEARILGINCVLDFIKTYNQNQTLPVILLGDFNAYPNSKTITFCDDYGILKDVTKNLEGTFHAFGKTLEKIDYIYVSEELSTRIMNVGLWNDVHEGIFLSDHYPVYVDIQE